MHRRLCKTTHAQEAVLYVMQLSYDKNILSSLVGITRCAQYVYVFEQNLGCLWRKFVSLMHSSRASQCASCITRRNDRTGDKSGINHRSAVVRSTAAELDRRIRSSRSCNETSGKLN